MKKIIFLLLFPFLMLAQNPTNFPYGIKNTAAKTDNTPAYFTTTQVDGVHKKTPAATIALKTDLDLKQTVFTGICQKQYLTENDIVIDNTALTLTIATVKNGTTISPSNPVRFFTDGNGVAVMHEKTAPVVFNFTNTTGVWYFYFNSSGNPIATQTVWNDFSTIATVYRFYWNATLSTANKRVIESVEYHKNDISWADHTWKHLDGARYGNGLDISSNAISTGTPNANGTNAVISLSSGTNIDDNIFYTITNTQTGTTKFTQDLGTGLLPATSGKFITITNNAGGLLDKIPATDFPFLWNSTTNTPEYLTVNGTRTGVAANYFFVYYVYSLQDPRRGETIKIKSAETDFANITLANAHNWEQLQALFPTLRDGEIRLMYKLTFEYKTAFDVGTKKTALRFVDDLRKQKTTTTAVASGVLPATSVTVSPIGGIASTNAQSALQELDSDITDIKASLPTSYSKVVYVNTTSPNAATIFDLINPPVTNDNLLKNDVANLYIGTDASTWVYNGSTYVTKVVPASSNYYIEGTNIDAGNSKTANVQRTGGAIFGNFLYSYGEVVSKKGGSDTVLSGSNFRLSNNAGSENNTFQLNASNGVDLWNYASGSWNKRFTFSSDGKLGFGLNPSARLDLGNISGNLIHIGDSSTDSFISPSYWDTYGTDFGFFTHGIYNLVFSPQGTGKSIFSMGDVNISAGNLTVSGTVAATSYTGSATFTGTPTAPTATAGTNTTQIATTAFVLANSLNLSGNQTKTGILSFSNSTFPVQNAINLSNSGGSSSYAQLIQNTSSGDGLSILNSSSGNGNYILNSSAGKGLYVLNSSNSGAGIYSENFGGATGLLFQGYNEGTVFSVNKDGVTTSTQYKISSLNTAPSSATDTGTLGEVRITATYIYVCTATNTWVRTALSTW